MLCANLEGASLVSCNFDDPAGSAANMEGVNLKEATLEGSNMARINLRVATVKNANLKSCDLRGAVLAGADLEVCTSNCLPLYEISHVPFVNWNSPILCIIVLLPYMISDIE